MITAEQHLQLGLALGYPTCCVEQWVAELGSGEQGLRRGSIVVRVRLPHEHAALLERVTEVLGADWTGNGPGVETPAAWLRAALADPWVKYVPCDSCAAERNAARIEVRSS